MKLSKDGETDKIRKEGKERSAEILKSFPQFVKGAEKKEETKSVENK